jgi:transposase InsO family protein
MGREAIPMDLRLMAAVTGPLTDLNVAALCREHGISPKTFYKWRRRFRAEGLAGLEPRSRRPHRSPQRVSEAVEDAVVGVRKELVDAGLDAGAATIRYHLAKRRVAYPPPSEATIWRILVRRGFVVPQPRKRPKSSLHRFEAEFPNECWQIDATGWELADLTPVDIINVLDDHSRLAAESLAVPIAATCETAWTAFSRAMERYGVPWRCLSDNGLCFSGRLRGFEVDFEVRLREAGIKAVTSRPYHAQTCGKVERFQQTLKKWLRAHGPFATCDDLQNALDTFRDYYNHHRPHRAIGRTTPYERWNATPRVATPDRPLPGPIVRTRVQIGTTGQAWVRHAHLREQFAIGLGVEYSGLSADILFEAGHAAVFVNDKLIRYFKIDPHRRYQPSGRRRGGPKRPRLT